MFNTRLRRLQDAATAGLRDKWFLASALALAVAGITEITGAGAIIVATPLGIMLVVLCGRLLLLLRQGP